MAHRLSALSREFFHSSWRLITTIMFFVAVSTGESRLTQGAQLQCLSQLLPGRSKHDSELVRDIELVDLHIDELQATAITERVVCKQLF